MSWIKTISYENADRRLRRLYDKVKGPNNNIDNVLTIHSLRPHTLTGHMTLYKSVLHNSNNTLPKWYLEAIGVYVSFLNKCDYCVHHHLSGMKRLLGDDAKSNLIWQAIQLDTPQSYFEGKELLGLIYAQKLTTDHTAITKDVITNLLNSGLTDGEVLEINQVAAYFNYVNRMVIGLGVDTEGDIIGLSPGDSDDPNNWEHQ